MDDQRAVYKQRFTSLGLAGAWMASLSPLAFYLMSANNLGGFAATLAGAKFSGPIFAPVAFLIPITAGIAGLFMAMVGREYLPVEPLRSRIPPRVDPTRPSQARRP